MDRRTFLGRCLAAPLALLAGVSAKAAGADKGNIIGRIERAIERTREAGFEPHEIHASKAAVGLIEDELEAIGGAPAKTTYWFSDYSELLVLGLPVIEKDQGWLESAGGGDFYITRYPYSAATEDASGWYSHERVINYWDGERFVAMPQMTASERVEWDRAVAHRKLHAG